MGNAVALDVAHKEIESWLDHKRVKAKKRENFAEQIDDLAEAMSSGDLSLDGDFNLVQQLQFPIKEGDSERAELKFKPRMKVGAFHIHLKGVKADDVDGRILGYVTGLTGVPAEIIKRLDSEDYDVCKGIAVFFL